MEQKPYLILIKGGLSIFLLLTAILYLLSSYFYNGDPDLILNFFGALFFAGMYPLLGSGALHLFLRRGGAYEGSIGVNLMVQESYVDRGLTVGANEEKIEHGYIRGIADPTIILYGYFTDVLCFRIGFIGAASMIR